jgi:CRISPR type III-A-associated RAMP protein Csm5
VEKNNGTEDYMSFAEWIIPNSRTSIDIRTDDYLFTESANHRLGFRGVREQTIRELADTCNDYSRTLIRTEKQFYETHGLGDLEDFYADLEDITLPKGAFLLNIGWGSGWEFKTLGDLIKLISGKQLFSQVRQKYRLGEVPKTHEMHLNAPFPHTRRLAYEGGAPAWSMGWVVLDPVL